MLILHNLGSYILIMWLYPHSGFVNQCNLGVGSRILLMSQFFLCYCSLFIFLLRCILVSKEDCNPRQCPQRSNLRSQSKREQQQVLILGSENMTCWRKLKESGLFRLNERKDTMFVCSYIKYCQKAEKTNSFCIPLMDRMRSHRIKLQGGLLRLDI